MKKKLKRLEPVIVHWNDAWKNSDIRLSLEGAINYTEEVCPTRTIGFLIEINNDYVALSQHVSDESHRRGALFSDFYHIPMSLVTKIEELSSVKKRKSRIKQVKKTKPKKRK